MSTQFGKGAAAGEGIVKKIFTGVENFKVVAINPNHQQLIDMYGERAKEPTYTGKAETGEAQIMINFFLDNMAEEGEESIKTRLTFFVVNKERITNAGDKKEFINVYGQSAWLPLDGTVPANMSWFDTEGMRPAYNGEVNVIQTLRNLLNLPSKANADNPAEAKSQFSQADWQAMFGGNFSVLQGVAAQTENKLGVLLGAKTTGEGKVYQDTFNRSTLRQYSKASGRFNYLRDEVENSQNNGAYPNTDFGDPSYKLAEFLEGATPSASTEAKAPSAQAFSGFDAETSNAFQPAGQTS